CCSRGPSDSIGFLEERECSRILALAAEIVRPADQILGPRRVGCPRRRAAGRGNRQDQGGKRATPTRPRSHPVESYTPPGASLSCESDGPPAGGRATSVIESPMRSGDLDRDPLCTIERAGPGVRLERR